MDALDSVLRDLVDADRDCAYATVDGYLRCGADPRGRHDDLNKSGGDVINEE